MAISFLNYFNRISMPVAGASIMRELGLDEIQLGWVYTSLLIADACCMIPGGWLSDRRGGWAALVLVGFGTAVCVGLTGLIGLSFLVGIGASFPALITVRGLFGAFTAPLYPAAGRVVTHRTPFESRALVNGLITGAAMVGIGLTYPIFATLIDAVGWKASFLITGAITAALASVWTLYGFDAPRRDSHPAAGLESETGGERFVSDSKRLAPNRARDRQPLPRGSWARVLHRSLILLTFSYAAVGYIEYLVFYWSEHYFKEILDLGAEKSRLAAMLPPLAMAVGMPLGGWFSDRLILPLGYRRARASVAMGGMLACATMLATATSVGSVPLIVACFTFALGAIGICEGATWPTAIALGGRRNSGLTAAIANTGGNAGGFISPVLTPYVSAHLSSSLGRESAWAWSLRRGCLVCALGAILWIWIDARQGIESDDRVWEAI